MQTLTHNINETQNIKDFKVPRCTTQSRTILTLKRYVCGNHTDDSYSDSTHNPNHKIKNKHSFLCKVCMQDRKNSERLITSQKRRTLTVCLSLRSGRVGLGCGRRPLLSSLAPLRRPLRMGICKVRRRRKRWQVVQNVGIQEINKQM